MPPEDRPRAGRRTVLAATLAAGLGVLGGCGVRLEEDAPRVPFVPARTPLPAEDLLVAATGECARLATLAALVDGPVAARLTTVHRRQHTVLRTSLLRDGVPAEVVDPGSPSAAPAPSPSGSPARRDLGRAEAESARGAASFADVADAWRAPVAALHAQRWAAARILGVPAATAGSGAAPVAAPGDPLPEDVVEDLAARVGGAVYLLEVAAARASPADRDRALAGRAALLDLRADVVGDASAPRRVGRSLPFAVDSPADARRLARETVTTLRSDLGARLDTLAAVGPDGLVAAVRWLGTVEVEVHRWGVDLAPFPGLT